MNGLYIAFAPLQGYTDAVYRRAHHECVGGVDEYYTPFVRIEKGEVRRKDLRDTAPTVNEGVPTVPQVIARDGDEFARLCDALQGQGWGRIDLNMGCPFPMQVKAGRGCGLLQHPERIEEIQKEMLRRPEVTFSVKMRLGQESEEEGLSVMPIVNEMPLLHVTLHPRLGKQQYKGTADREAFARFMEVCTHPIIYNGDMTHAPTLTGTPSNFAPLRSQAVSPADPGREGELAGAVDFTKLKGVMLGRGLLARPWMTHAPTLTGTPSNLEGELAGAVDLAKLKGVMLGRGLLARPWMTHAPALTGTLSNFAPLRSQAVSPADPGREGELAGAVDFTKLKGVMLGRGLLARPWMLSDKEPHEVIKAMHAVVYRHATENLCGDSQILSRLHAFWDYLDIPHKQKKAIMKATTLPRYRESVANLP